MNYITPAELKEFTMIPGIKALPDAEILKKIMVAQMRIEAYCNQTFDSESKAIEVDGTGSNMLVLDKRIYKLNSLFFDFRNWESNAVTTEDGWKIKLKHDSMWDILKKETAEQQIPKFTKGIANVLVDAEWGWAEIPREVKFCMCKLTEAYCLFIGDEESLMAESGIYKKQTIGGYSYELKDTKDVVPTQSTGDATVDTLLKKFKRTLKKNSMKVDVI